MQAQQRQVVGIAELMYMLGLSRNRVVVLTGLDDFPVPEELRMGKVWPLAGFQTWAAAHGRVLKALPDTWPLVADDSIEGAPLRGGKYRRAERSAQQASSAAAASRTANAAKRARPSRRSDNDT